MYAKKLKCYKDGTHLWNLISVGCFADWHENLSGWPHHAHVPSYLLNLVNVPWPPMFNVNLRVLSLFEMEQQSHL